jgi:hypothetical protein
LRHNQGLPISVERMLMVKHHGLKKETITIPFSFGIILGKTKDFNPKKKKNLKGKLKQTKLVKKTKITKGKTSKKK